MLRFIDSNFIKSSTLPENYPDNLFPDLVFVGKSNVGKSSLINKILNRKKLAKTSNTPGKTRLINFFKVRFQQNDTKNFLNFVDLPGYGYAKVSKKEQNRWKTIIEKYFASRKNILGVFLLVDARHKADYKDKMMAEMLFQHRIPFILVATKVDKIRKTKRISYKRKLEKEYGLRPENIIMFSAQKSIGKNKLILYINELIALSRGN